MLHIVEIANPFIKRSPLFGLLLLPAVIAFLAISVGAQCSTGWDANGEWAIFQRGQVNPITLTLQQKGRVIQGRAVHKIPNNFGEITNGGMVDGTIDGDTITFQVFWPPNGTLIGVYNAKILPSGRLDGETYDKNRPNIRQTWFSGAALKCPPPPPPPLAPKPLRSTGKAKQKPPASSQPNKPEPPPMQVPGIIASQVIYTHPLAFTGFVVLTWDAGPDHPYAEVWYKVNNGDDTFLVELGKGSRQMPVEKGKLYTYVLTDAGQTLATVSVVGN